MLSIIEYIKKNGLERAVEDFKLICKEYESKILLKYNQIDSDMSLKEVRESRGLILERGTWKILSMSFEKFFNSAETYAAKINWDTAHILEKEDGSLISAYWDWNINKWCAATTGTANGEGEVNNKLGTTFSDLFWKTVEDKYALNDCLLDKDHVYMFELCTPYNIVVKPHDESSATLLAVRNRITLNEVDYDGLGRIADSLRVPLVKRYDLNAKNAGALIKTLEGMPFTEEGYVVLDGNFNRIKIKNPAYLAVHHLKGKTAEHNILTIVKSNEIEEFASTFPERREEIFNLHKNYNELIGKLEGVWSILEPLKPKNITPGEKKRYAMEVFRVCEENDTKMFTGLFFGLNDGKVESVKDFMFNFDNKKLYQLL